MAVVGISVCIIALLVAAMFGAVFVAVNATKDTILRCIDDKGWLSPTFDHCPGYSIPAVQYLGECSDLRKYL